MKSSKLKVDIVSTLKKIKSSYVYCSPHFLFGEKNSP